MKKFTFLKMMLLAVVMTAGSMGMKAADETYTYTTGDGSWITENVERLYQSTNFSFLHKKNSSSTNIATTYTELRVYASHSMEVYPTVAGKKITSIEVTAGSGAYATAMGNATVLAGTSSTTATSVTGISSVNASVVTFNLSGVSGCEYVKFTLAAQSRTLSWKITYTDGGGTSTTSTPTFTPPAGTYTSVQSVELASTTSGAKIYYTTDGTEPTSASTLYTGAINVAATTTIKAIAYDAAGANPSAVVSALYTINLNPSITVTPASLTNFFAYVGKTQDKTLTVSGANLTADIQVVLSGTNASKFSVAPVSLAQTAGTVASTTVTVTYTPTEEGSHTATLTISSAGVTDVIYALTGSSTFEPLVAPVANEATSVTSTGFTANWESVTNATEYELNVYTKSDPIASDLFISEYGEGSSNNKYIEIFNGTGAAVDLSAYTLKQSNNNIEWPTETTSPYYLALSGTLANNDVYVISTADANPTILAQADLKITYSTTDAGGKIVSFTGNDAMGLFKNDVLIDVFGDPTSSANISVAGYSTYGSNHTIVRKSSIYTGNTNWTTSAGTNKEDSEWVGYAQDTWTYLGSHSIFAKTPAPNSPFTGITGTSQAVTGLDNANTYYYTVIAKNANVTSPVSNEVGPVALVATGLNNAKQDAQARAYNGKVMFSASAGETVEIFNTVGQKLVSRTAAEGLNEISLNVKGVLVVKVGNRVSKVVL